MSKSSKLQKLYQIMHNSEELGLPLNDETIAQINEMEEKLIKNEVLPLIHDNIEPTLREVERPLVLVVEYDPNGALRVNLSRKVNIAATISDAKEITPDPVVDHTEKKKGFSKTVTQPRTRLRITMPDGSVIQEKTAWESLRKFVLVIGVDKVRAVGVIANKIPLVSNTVDAKYKNSQKPLGKGWLLMTCSDTATKRKQILAVAGAYDMQVKVEII